MKFLNESIQKPPRDREFYKEEAQAEFPKKDDEPQQGHHGDFSIPGDAKAVS